MGCIPIYLSQINDDFLRKIAKINKKPMSDMIDNMLDNYRLRGYVFNPQRLKDGGILAMQADMDNVLKGFTENE